MPRYKDWLLHDVALAQHKAKRLRDMAKLANVIGTTWPEVHWDERIAHLPGVRTHVCIVSRPQLPMTV